MLLAREFHAARFDHMQHVSGNTIDTDCLTQLSLYSMESPENHQKMIAMMRDYFHKAMNPPYITNHGSYIHRALQGLQGIGPGKGKGAWSKPGP